MKSNSNGPNSHDCIRGGFVVVGSLLHHAQSPRLKLKRKLSDRKLKWPAIVKPIKSKLKPAISSCAASFKSVSKAASVTADKCETSKTLCPLKANAQCECGVPDCNFIAVHVCKLEKYQREEDEHVRERMVGEALTENEIMKAKIRLLKAALGIN